MNDEYLSLLVKQLQAQGVVFAEGLSDDEVNNIEATYNFQFPPDLKAFLQYQLPISDVFVDWRNDSYDEIKRRLDNVRLESFLFPIRTTPAFFLSSFYYRALLLLWQD